MSLYQHEILEDLGNFYRNKKNVESFEKIKGSRYNKKKITLSKIYDKLIECRSTNFELFLAFSSVFKLYSKKNFDIFSRGKKYYLCTLTNKIFSEKAKSQQRIETTLPQLNFFKFIIENKVIEKLQRTQHHSKEKIITFESRHSFQPDVLWV